MRGSLFQSVLMLFVALINSQSDGDRVLPIEFFKRAINDKKDAFTRDFMNFGKRFDMADQKYGYPLTKSDPELPVQGSLAGLIESQMQMHPWHYAKKSNEFDRSFLNFGKRDALSRKQNYAVYE